MKSLGTAMHLLRESERKTFSERETFSERKREREMSVYEWSSEYIMFAAPAGWEPVGVR